MPERDQRSSVMLQLAAGIAILALAGCQGGANLAQTLTDLTNRTRTMVNAPPPDDGTVCYRSYRVPFYREANNSDRTDSVVKGLGGVATALMRQSRTGAYSQQVSSMLTNSFVQTVQAVVKDIENETARVQRLTQRFNALMNCRRREAEDINRRFNQKRISLSAAQVRMATLRALTTEDISTAREANAQISARTEEFTLATEAAREQVAAARTPQEQQRRDTEVKKAEEAVQTNQKALNDSVASVEQAEALVKETEGGFNLQSRRGSGTVLVRSARSA